MLEVRIVVDAPANWIKTVNQSQSALIKIMDVKRSGDDQSVQDFVEISSTKVNAGKLIESLESSHGIQNVDLVQLDHHRIMGTITTAPCPVCSTLSGLNCSLLSANTREDQKMDWRLLISGNDTLKEVTRRLQEKGVNFEILEISQISAKKDLTARQEYIVRIALDLGFFDFPKKIRLEELSNRLSVSPGTLSEILRRAEKNILSKYFREK